jgi:hypothetical protein
MSILGRPIIGAAYIKAVIAAVARNPERNSFFTALLLETNSNLPSCDTWASKKDSGMAYHLA